MSGEYEGELSGGKANGHGMWIASDGSMYLRVNTWMTRRTVVAYYG